MLRYSLALLTALLACRDDGWRTLPESADTIEYQPSGVQIHGDIRQAVIRWSAGKAPNGDPITFYEQIETNCPAFRIRVSMMHAETPDRGTEHFVAESPWIEPAPPSHEYMAIHGLCEISAAK